LSAVNIAWRGLRGAARSRSSSSRRPDPSCRRRTYPVGHPELGTLEIFIVPLEPKNGGNQYEVIFT